MKHEVVYEGEVPHRRLELELTDNGTTSIVIALPSGKEVIVDLLPEGGTDSKEPTVVVEAGGGFAVYEERLRESGQWEVTWPRSIKGTILNKRRK